MAIVHVLPLKPFHYARDGVHPELFEPGKDAHGNKAVFEFMDNQADNIQRLGLGRIVTVRKEIILPDDPELREAMEQKIAEIAAREDAASSTVVDSIAMANPTPQQTVVVQHIQPVSLAAAVPKQPLADEADTDAASADGAPQKKNRKFKV